MVQTGLVVPDDLYDLPLDVSIDIAQEAERAGFDVLWKGEASGSNAFMLLSSVATVTEEVALGTGIANVYSRSPALLGMSAATLDHLSGGRARLGIGVSTPAIVQNWHACTFDQPLRRARESIEIIRSIVEGGTVEYQGEIFEIGPYSVGLSAIDGDVPIYNAAMSETNRRLTAEFTEGWMPVLTPLSSLRDLASEVRELARQAGREPPTVAPWIPIAVADDHDQAEQLMRGHLAQEMGMGYNRLARKFGYGAAADEAHDRWRAGDRDGAAAAISDRMLSELAVYGSPSECREQLASYVDAGADLLVLWPSFTANRDDIDAVVETFGTFSA